MINIQRVNPQTGQISEVIELDVTLDVNLTHTMSVTDFPVEDGVNISDHVQEQPAQVAFRGIVSATPLRFFSFNPIIGNDRTRAAFEILTELQKNRELVRIVTDVASYDNMVLTSLTVPRRKDTKNSLMFTATFREVRIVSSQIVTLPPDDDVQETATQQEDGGKVTPKPTASTTETEKASTLYRILNGIGVID